MISTITAIVNFIAFLFAIANLVLLCKINTKGSKQYLYIIAIIGWVVVITQTSQCILKDYRIKYLTEELSNKQTVETIAVDKRWE